jgi:hypothetical protein
LSDLVDHPLLLLVVSVLSYPIYKELALAVFGSKSEFLEALRYWITPDAWSLFKGQFWNDWDAEFKLGVFLVLCIGAVAALYKLCVACLY